MTARALINEVCPNGDVVYVGIHDLRFVAQRPGVLVDLRGWCIVRVPVVYGVGLLQSMLARNRKAARSAAVLQQNLLKHAVFCRGFLLITFVSLKSWFPMKTLRRVGSRLTISRLSGGAYPTNATVCLTGGASAS